MKKENKIAEMFNEVNPLIEGLPSNELFTLAGFCVVELVIKNIGAKNFNGKHEEEVYSEIKSLCITLEKTVKTAFTLSMKEK